MPHSAAEDSTWQPRTQPHGSGSSILLPSLPAPLLPFLPPHSSCPPFILRQDEHALGVAFWAVPLLARHSTTLFNTCRRHSQQHGGTADCETLVQCTRTLLLINPDNATAWNARKCLLAVSVSSLTSLPSSTAPPVSLSAELLFLSFLFSKHPKSSEAWSHRRWTAQRLLDQSDDTSDAVMELLLSELSVVEMTAERYPKNYHAWLYRRWIVQLVDGRHRELHADTQGGQRWRDVLKEEQQRIAAWNESHMSDHSGWHYRSFVIDRMLAAAHYSSSTLSHRSQLTAELSYLSSLQLLYPAHESAWAYRRFLLHSAVTQYADSDVERQQWRRGEDEWCEERERVGCCSNEDDWGLERRYARTHRLYVTELVLRAQQPRPAEGEKVQSVEGLLRAMTEPERTRWLCDVASVQQVYPRRVWMDRMALVT